MSGQLRGLLTRVSAPSLKHVRKFAVSPGDAFSTQLQAKTERELKELLEKSNRPVSEAAAETKRQESKVS